MIILFDTNIILDALLQREPFVKEAAKLFMAIDKKVITGFLCATSMTTVNYILSKSIGYKKALFAVQQLLRLFMVAPVNYDVLFTASTSGFKDFEDAVLYESALTVQARGIVTRNPGDFKKAKIQIYSPTELLYNLKSIEN